MPPTKVIFYQDDDSVPVLEWLKSLPPLISKQVCGKN